MSDSDAFAALDRRSIKQSQSFNWPVACSAPVETSEKRCLQPQQGKEKGISLQLRLFSFASASRGHVSGGRVARALSQPKPAHERHGARGVRRSSWIMVVDRRVNLSCLWR
jgi:hypothetical protein